MTVHSFCEDIRQITIKVCHLDIEKILDENKNKHWNSIRVKKIKNKGLKYLGKWADS